ncbi:putative orphan protein [Pseudoalteromonas sp. JB197]|nr:putative orphan protein [Pseudoalteromonas sp. JB197]
MHPSFSNFKQPIIKRLSYTLAESIYISVIRTVKPLVAKQQQLNSLICIASLFISQISLQKTHRYL